MSWMIYGRFIRNTADELLLPRLRSLECMDAFNPFPQNCVDYD